MIQVALNHVTANTTKRLHLLVQNLILLMLSGISATSPEIGIFTIHQRMILASNINTLF